MSYFILSFDIKPIISPGPEGKPFQKYTLPESFYGQMWAGAAGFALTTLLLIVDLIFCACDGRKALESSEAVAGSLIIALGGIVLLAMFWSAATSASHKAVTLAEQGTREGSTIEQDLFRTNRRVFGLWFLFVILVLIQLKLILLPA